MLERFPIHITHVQLVTPSPLFNVEKDIMYLVVFKSITTLTEEEGEKVYLIDVFLVWKHKKCMETQEM